MLKSILKASLIASAVFALAWYRAPLSVMIVRYFVIYGILIVLISMAVGLPIVALIQRLKIGRWWSYLLSAVAAGGLVGALLSSHPTLEGCAHGAPASGSQDTCIENPFAITFSPWTRSQPGFADNPPIQWSDYAGTVGFGALIGGVIGISFWFFDRTRKR